MPVHTLLIAGLKESLGNLILQPSPASLQVVDFQAGAWSAWVEAIGLKIDQSVTPDKLREMVEQVHIDCPRSREDGRQLLQEGAGVALFVDNRQGRKPFWTDTIVSLRAVVRF